MKNNDNNSNLQEAIKIDHIILYLKKSNSNVNQPKSRKYQKFLEY